MKHRTTFQVLILVFAACVTGLGFFYKQPIQSTQDPMKTFIAGFPQTPQEVNDYVKETCMMLDTQASQFSSIHFQDRTFDNTIGQWDEIGMMLTERMITLKSLSITGVSDETAQAAEAGFFLIKKYLYEKLISTPSIPFGVISFLEKTETGIEFTPSEWNYINQLAQTLNSGWFPLLYQRKIDAIKARISMMPRNEYSYIEGLTREKLINENAPGFSILNFNVCFLPGKLSLLYGGMLPWKSRIKKIAARINQIDADIVCLQEVFEGKAAEMLIEQMKGNYAHFYINIGPRTFGFTEASAGLSSGLFLASKIKIENPEYIPFEKSGIHMKRGFFNFSLSCAGSEIAHIYTTHLEAFNEHPGPELRKHQLDQILCKMNEHSNKTSSQVASVLCGDLNIPLQSNESAEHLLRDHFIDNYNKANARVTLENRTYLDFTDVIWKAKLDMKKFTPNPEILDYALLLKNQPAHSKQRFSLYTALIPMNDIAKPLDALSDHHAEISLVLMKK
jgi:endonuclease/exonuclease/phosphatase family metal-dependent hydrolase